MENEFNTLPAQLLLLEQLRPFVIDEDAYGRIYPDLHDIFETDA
jgi:hypothetical protein